MALIDSVLIVSYIKRSLLTAIINVDKMVIEIGIRVMRVRLEDN